MWILISLLILSGLSSLILGIIDLTKTRTTTAATSMSPTAVSSLSASCGCANLTLSLTNILFNTTGVTYQWQSSLQGQNSWSNMSTPSSSSTLSVSAQNNSTDYRCMIMMASPSIISFASTTATVANAFCASTLVNCSAFDTIDSFILIGEEGTKIYDLATGCSSNSYRKLTSMSATLYVGSTYYIIATTQRSTNEYISVWIDFNDNSIFEPTENLANILYNGTANTPVTITIPSIGAGGTLGVHYMRAVASNSNSALSSCANSNVAYGETHDYSVNITTSPCKFRIRIFLYSIILFIANIVKYCQPFITDVIATSQCTEWTNFVSQLTVRPYTSMTLLSSNDPTGVTLTDPTIIGNIAAALRTSTTYGPVTSNGRSWVVGGCGGGHALSASGTPCACPNPANIVRPCIINNVNWGGIGGAVCSAVTQTIVVVFQY